MYPLFETIRIEDGKPQNLLLHDERMNRSRQRLFGSTDMLKISEYLKIPVDAGTGITRCRIIYSDSFISSEFSPYVSAGVKTLRKVDAGTIDYEFKYLDRSLLINLIDKNLADDILIVKDGFITDVSFANIVFTDGREWVTPDTPLLRGTMRELLLRKGIIREERLTINDIPRFTHFRLINAMLCFDAPIWPVSNIY